MRYWITYNVRISVPNEETMKRVAKKMKIETGDPLLDACIVDTIETKIDGPDEEPDA